jgi:hypothetical protein
MKIPKGGKKTWEKLINSICEEAGCCQVCWEKRFLSSLVVMNTTKLSVRQEEPVETDFPCCYEQC